MVVAAADLADGHARQRAHQGGHRAVLKIAQPQRTVLASTLQAVGVRGAETCNISRLGTYAHRQMLTSHGTAPEQARQPSPSIAHPGEQAPIYQQRSGVSITCRHLDHTQWPQPANGPQHLCACWHVVRQEGRVRAGGRGRANPVMLFCLGQHSHETNARGGRSPLLVSRPSCPHAALPQLNTPPVEESSRVCEPPAARRMMCMLLTSLTTLGR